MFVLMKERNNFKIFNILNSLIYIGILFLMFVLKKERNNFKIFIFFKLTNLYRNSYIKTISIRYIHWSVGIEYITIDSRQRMSIKLTAVNYQIDSLVQNVYRMNKQSLGGAGWQFLAKSYE